MDFTDLNSLMADGLIFSLALGSFIGALIGLLGRAS